MFSGIGGFDLALRNLNHTIVGACEIDRYARQVYGRHFPGIKIYENATTIKPEELPDFDILAAGFPCQAFSIAGKRRGFADTRGSLFFEIARVAKEKRPSILLLENVKGILSHDKGNTFKTIINTLDEIGYDAEWQVLNSKYFVPQTRERVYIIGHLRGRGTRQIFPLGEIQDINARTPKETQKQGKWVRSTHTRAIDANYAKGGGSRTMIAVIMNGHNTQNGRKVNEDYSFALTTHKEQYLASLKGVRSLTPKECERLQGFPDNWTKYDNNGKEISDTQRYKMCGNAVTVPVIEYIISNYLL